MWHWVAIISVALVAFLLLLVMIEPGLRYQVTAAPEPLDSEAFLCLLGTLSDAPIHRQSQIDVLTNGSVFYDAQLDAIRNARRSINLEAYIFRESIIGRQFVYALAERARAGVKVKLVLDAIGNLRTRKHFFHELTKSGGQVFWYQPIRWYTFKRLNNRTHRELLIVDGEVGFIGGAGVNDWWTTGDHRGPAWRDTVCRITGELVVSLQSAFAENWLESAEEILMGDEYFPACTQARIDAKRQAPGASAPDQAANLTEPPAVAGLVVMSTPSAARSTRARILFQTLIASARETIHITSPYFVPDRSMRRELIRAVRERGVKVRVLTPGAHNNHATTRLASRRRYGDLLRAGVQISEYQPSMIHVKCLVVDGVWSVVGSTNVDNRSFGLNDEVNVAVMSRATAERLGDDFERDMRQSKTITYEAWRRRPMKERLMELVFLPLDRQE